MKRINIKGLFILLLAVTGVTVVPQAHCRNAWFCLQAGNFPVTNEHYLSASGPVYTQFRKEIPVSYWFLQSLSTDEAILPSHAGNWFDGAQYIQLHFHTWTKENNMVNQSWNWITTTISTCNQVLQVVLAAAPEIAPCEKANDGGNKSHARPVVFYYA